MLGTLAATRPHTHTPSYLPAPGCAALTPRPVVLPSTHPAARPHVKAHVRQRCAASSDADDLRSLGTLPLGLGTRLRRPNLQEGVPATRAEARAVGANAEAADAVVVAGEAADLFAGERVPHVAVEIVVAGEEVPPADRVRHGGDAAQDLVMSVLLQLGAAACVKEAARGVVRACTRTYRGRGTV